MEYDRSTGVYLVETREGRGVLECLYTSPMFCRLLGIQMKSILPAGSRVQVCSDDHHNYIVGCISSNRSVGTTNSLAYGTELPAHARGSGRQPMTADLPPTDLLEGELDMTNAMEVGVQLLTFFSRLTGGDRAVVETCVLNDMVRVVSQVFRHHSAFGDQRIYNDGRLNSVEHGTSYEHEAWGLEGEEQPKLELGEDGLVDQTQVQEVGRWRMSRFMGFLGDFVHLIVSDPTEGLGRMASDAYRAGKARVQVLSDGALLAQSVSEICLERVCRVQVPIQLKDEDAPDGVLAEHYEQMEGRFLRIWEGLKEGQERQDLANICYQMREYARWLSGFYSLRRFHQAASTGDGRVPDWEVPTEDESPTPSWTNQEEDSELQNEQALGHYDTYACIRIMRDGSIVVWSGDGSSLVMAGGSVQLQASRHLELAAAGDVRIRAGRDLHLLARRHVSLTAVVGGLRLKARTYWEALCEWGTMWLKSDADVDNPTTAAAGDPEPVVRDWALMLDSVRGGTLVNSEDRVLINSNKAENLEEPPEVAIQSRSGRVAVHTGRDFSIQARNYVWDIARGVYGVCNEWVADCRARFTVLKKFGAVGSRLEAQALYAQTVDAEQGLRSREGSQISKTTQDSEVDDPYAHADPTKSLNYDEAQTSLPERQDAWATQPLWDYLPDDYQGLDVPREGLTEQFLRLDLPADWSADFDTWGPTDTRLKAATRTGGGQPIAPADEQELRTDGGSDLRQPAEAHPASNKPKPISRSATSWHYLKPDED